MEAKRIIEAALFLSPRPLLLKELAELVGEDVEEVEGIVETLEEEYKGRGIVVERIGNAVRMYVAEDVFPYVRHLSPVPEFDERERKVVAEIAVKGKVRLSTLRKKYGKTAERCVEKLLGLGAVMKRKEGKAFVVVKTRRFDEYFLIQP